MDPVIIGIIAGIIAIFMVEFACSARKYYVNLMAPMTGFKINYHTSNFSASYDITFSPGPVTGREYIFDRIYDLWANNVYQTDKHIEGPLQIDVEIQGDAL